MKKFRVLFFGTWGYGKAGLEGLLKSNNVEIVEVFTKWQPDKPNVYMDQVKSLATKNNLNSVNTHKKYCTTTEFTNSIFKHKDIDFVFSCCYDRIFKSEVVSFPKKMPVNVHPSLLPKYRGVKPLENAIVNNEDEVGVTLHELEKELDSGKILYQKGGIKIRSDQTYDDLYEQQCDLISHMVYTFFQSPEIFIEKALEQDEINISFAPRLPFLIEGNMKVKEIIALSK